MELSGNNSHIHQNEVECVQTEWDLPTVDVYVNTTTFSRTTGPNKYKRLWDKMCKVIVCTAVIETASICGFVDNPTHYTQPFVSTESARDGGYMRMNDIREWKKKKDNNLSQIQNTVMVSPEALAFIENNKYLIPILVSANQKLLEYFPHDKLNLDLVNDPEENSDSLFLSVESSLKPELALERLQNFDQDWWLDEVSKTNDKLCIDVVFV